MTIPMSKILGMHTLTTGYDSGFEAVELAIVNGAGDVLFDERLKPMKKTRWSVKNQKHGVLYKHVKDCPTIAFYEKELLSILRPAKKVVAYSGEFHALALSNSGFTYLEEKKHVIDVMDLHARNYLERTEDDIYWYDEFGDRHRRKYVRAPQAVTMSEAVMDFPNVLEGIGYGDAGDAVWAAAASVFMYLEMCKREDRGTARSIDIVDRPYAINYAHMHRLD